MILYFSATGNSKYVATRVADALGAATSSIPDRLDADALVFNEDVFGVVSPTYYYGLPSIVCDFLEKAQFTANYSFFVATYGTRCGATGHLARRYAHASIDALFSVRMPDTWTPTFDLSTPEKVAAFEATTESDIECIIEKAGARAHGDFMRDKVPSAIAVPGHALTYDRARKTAHLHVEDSCIGCGLCARKCPVHAIEMRDKRPVWVKDRCVMCLGCLHRCPTFSIQYDDRTRDHGQYANPHVRV